MANISRSKTRISGFTDGEMDFQLMRQLGVCHSGAASVGECLALVNQIKDGDPSTWVTAFELLAKQQLEDAQQRLQNNHHISAKMQFYKACNSFRAAEYYMPCADPKHQQLGLQAQNSFIEAIKYEAYHFQYFQIPFKSITLPCYFFSPKQNALSDKTIMIVSGFDGTLEEEFFFRGKAALERNYNLILMAGPGQMDVFRHYKQTYFEPDYEQPLSCVLDFLQKELNNNFLKLALMGISFGGYFATRAAIYDKRIKALIANSPIIDLYAYLAAFTHMDPCRDIPDSEDFSINDLPHIPEQEMPQQIKAQSEQLMYRFGRKSFKNTFAYLKNFNISEQIASLNIPCLGLCGEGEGEEPIKQYTKFNQVTKASQFLFSAAQGADSHCQVGNADYANAVAYDWLDELSLD